jgi:ketosteroid isomerase-like protein
MQPRAEGPTGKKDCDLRRRVFEITRLRMSGRISEMMEFFASDVVIHYHCAKEGLFLAGVLQGVEAFRENIRLTDAEYEPLESEVLDLLVEGERSAVRWRNSWRNRGTGYRRTLDMAHFLHWRNGRVVEMFEYLDYHGMMALACN